MQLLLCLILVSLGAAVVVGGCLKAAGKENPVDHINPPKIKDSHEMGRRLFAYICHKMNERN